MEKGKGTIRSFQDLKVYQNLYNAMLIVHKEILPKLPNEEKFGLKDQMRRASKAGPALIAEGFAKRYQKRQWHKYLDDAIGEANEMINHLSVCKDVYDEYIPADLCRDLVAEYDLAGKQLTKLKQVWTNYHEKK